MLWFHRMNVHTNTKETPFKLMFRQDVVILVEIRYLGHINNYLEETNDSLRVENLNFLEEDKDMTHIQFVVYKDKIKKYFDK